jgi:hypothetical protein
MAPGHDYVLIGRRAALAAPFTEMTQALHAALAQIHARLQGQKVSSERPGTGSTHSEALHASGVQSPAAGRRNHRRSKPAKPTEAPREGAE